MFGVRAGVSDGSSTREARPLMARIRSIHPDACKSESLAAVSAEAERCYWRLQTHCDDDGRCEDHPRLIWAALFPLHEDVGLENVDAWLSELDREGLVVRYEVDGKRYLYVTQWPRFQHPQKPKPSLLPAPPDTSTRRVRDEPGTDLVLVEPGEGVGEGGEEELIAPAKPPRKRDEIFDALCAETNTDPSQLTQTGRGPLNRATKDLRDQGATPDEIHYRAGAFRRRYPNIALTAPALSKHWASLGNGRSPAQPAPELTPEQEAALDAEWRELGV